MISDVFFMVNVRMLRVHPSWFPAGRLDQQVGSFRCIWRCENSVAAIWMNLQSCPVINTWALGFLAVTQVLYLCVFMCIYSNCIYICIYVYIYIYVYLYIYICISIYIYVYVYLYIYIYVYNICIYVYMYIYIYVYMCICIYVI